MAQFLISAGEASGEAYGAQLIGALRERVPDAAFFGLGGEAMATAECDNVIATRDISVVGLAEVVSHLPKIYAAFRRLLRVVDERRPVAAVLIDSPDFNFRLARALHRRGIPVFHYVSPQLWAWRPGRIELVRRYVRKMLVIFPFEEPWYRERGIDATYVGHPLADVPPPAITREEFAQRHGLDARKPWIALLPGSRRKEVSFNLPAMQLAARRLGGEYEYIVPVASTLEQTWVASHADRSYLTPGPEPSPVGPARFHYIPNQAAASLHHARAAVVASGTATVEAALAGTPLVMVYRVSPVTWTFGRRLVKVPHYGMVNLIAGREVVPELVQHNFTAANVLNRLREILADGPARERMLADLAEVRQKLHPPANGTAAQRAAAIIVAALRGETGASKLIQQ